jgi:branched-chain amino acid transport system permease protein
MQDHSTSSKTITPTLPQSAEVADVTSGWPDTIKANLPLPFVILCVWLLAMVFESRGFGAYNQRVAMLIGFNIILAVSLQLINGFSGQFSLGHAGFMAVGAYLAAYPTINLSQKLTDPAACVWFYITLALTVGFVGILLFLLFSGIRATKAFHSAAPMLLLIVLLAWILIDLSNAHSGFSLWTRAFYGISRGFNWMLARGHDSATSASTWLPRSMRQPICFVVLIVGGGCCAAVVGLIVGMPALRLRGDYLAIATLGFAEIIRILIQNSQPLGGALGLTGIPKYTDFAWLFGFAVITIVVIWRVAYSAKGRAIMAVREDEVAAAATGVDPTHHKVVAFIIGSFFGGVAGALFALHERSIAPYQFGLQKSIEIVVMVTLGGLGSISGAILAAAVLTVLLELLRTPPNPWPWGWVGIAIVIAIAISVGRRKARGFVITILILISLWQIGVILEAKNWVKLADFRMIIYSLSLVLLMLLRPQGLLGGRELWFKRRTIPPTLEPRSAEQESA